MQSDKKMISLLKGILNATPDLIFAKDTSFTYLASNEAFAHFIQRPIDKVEGYKDEDFFDDAALVEGFRYADRQILADEQVLRIEEWVTFPDGSKILLDTLKTPFYDNEGNLMGLLGISRDITDRIKQERLLIAAKEEAEHATAAKSDFIAKISHEIRTPMNAIIGLSRLSLKTDLSEEQRDYAEKIQYSGEALLGLINDILDFSKIEAGKLSIEQTPFSFNEIIDNVININAINAHKKNLELITYINKAIPIELIGDPFRLQQIFVNLVNNSVKFTEKGSIKISIDLKKETNKQVVLACSVSDTGIGMSEEQQEHLFESFSQADNTVTRKYGGTGLGLTISKELTELMGGAITLKSSLGNGSTFTFTLRLDKSTSAIPKQQTSVEDYKHLRILVVDDSSIARNVLMQILSEWCLNVEESHNGQDAIHAIEQAQLDGHPFDIVFMDWRMPTMDGIEASKRIAQLNLDHSPQILMVSAFDKDAAKSQAEKNNVNIHQFLEKPVNQMTLSTSINNVLYNKPQTFISPNIDEDYIPDFSTSHILMVEDNAINRQVAAGFLQDTKVSIDVAENGLIALEKVQSKQYDVVLMDIQMPEMDGLTATREIRNTLNFKSLPIIAMTAHAMATDKEKSMAAGMNEHITKPISPKQLYTSLLNYLTDEKAASTTHKTKASSVVELVEKIEFSNIESLKQVPNLDAAKALNNLRGKAPLYLNLLTDFYREQTAQVKLLSPLFSEEKWDELYRVIHTLKSNSAYIGAYALSTLCMKFEADLTEKMYQLSTLENIVEQANTLLLNLQHSQQVAAVPKEENVQSFNTEQLIKQLNEINGLLEASSFNVESAIPALSTLVAGSQYEANINVITQYILNVEYEKAVKLINRMIINLNSV